MNRILTLAAALTLGTVATYAEGIVKAHVPFEFKIGNHTHPAGDYTVVNGVVYGGSRFVGIRRDGESTQIVPAMYTQQPVNSVDTSARLLFHCASTGCSLYQVWAGGDYGSEFVQPKRKSAENQRLAVVYAHSAVAGE